MDDAPHTPVYRLIPGTKGGGGSNPPASLEERLVVIPQENPDGTVVWLLDLWGRHFDSAGIVASFTSLEEAEAARAAMLAEGGA